MRGLTALLDHGWAATHGAHACRRVHYASMHAQAHTFMASRTPQPRTSAGASMHAWTRQRSSSASAATRARAASPLSWHRWRPERSAGSCRISSTLRSRARYLNTHLLEASDPCRNHNVCMHALCRDVALMACSGLLHHECSDLMNLCSWLMHEAGRRK